MLHKLGVQRPTDFRIQYCVTKLYLLPFVDPVLDVQCVALGFRCAGRRPHPHRAAQRGPALVLALYLWVVLGCRGGPQSRLCSFGAGRRRRKPE